MKLSIHNFLPWMLSLLVINMGFAQTGESVPSKMSSTSLVNELSSMKKEGTIIQLNMKVDQQAEKLDLHESFGLRFRPEFDPNIYLTYCHEFGKWSCALVSYSVNQKEVIQIRYTAPLSLKSFGFK